MFFKFFILQTFHAEFDNLSRIHSKLTFHLGEVHNSLEADRKWLLGWWGIWKVGTSVESDDTWFLAAKEAIKNVD